MKIRWLSATILALVVFLAPLAAQASPVEFSAIIETGQC